MSGRAARLRRRRWGGGVASGALCVGLLVATCGAVAATAGDDVSASRDVEIERLVAEGAVDAVEARLAGDRRPEARGAIARAAANRARRATRPDERRRLFAAAEERFTRWITELEAAGRAGRVADRAQLAVARAQYGNAILATQVDSELIDYEASLGQIGDRGRLVAALAAARDQFNKADALLAPIVADIEAREAELLEAGLYDVVEQTLLDLRLSLGWTNYYLGALETNDAGAKRAALAAAEQRFAELVDVASEGPTRVLCQLALAMTWREQGKAREAEEGFARALAAAAAPQLDARVRYELARAQVRTQRFDEARRTLAPLLEKDAAQLAAADRPAALYIRLAHLWDAHALMLEANALRRGNPDAAIRGRPQQMREEAIGRLRAAERWPAPWPDLVRIYVTAGVDLQAAPAALSPGELLYTAQVLARADRPADARERLVAAAERTEIDSLTLGDVLFELGRVHSQLRDDAAAAATFSRLAHEHREHPRAAQAASLAYQLYGRIAERSKRPADYLALAAELRRLLDGFPEHPDRDEAAWLLGVALQLAGQHDQAAAAFAAVPRASRHGEEAQFRRALCLRLAWESHASDDAPSRERSGRDVARALLEYSRAAHTRGSQPGAASQTLAWAAEARAAAGEVLISAGVDAHQAALEALAEFERDFPESDQLGRVLAVRIRAHRGLRQFAEAAAILERFLQAVPAERVGPVLASLARGMQEEVGRLVAGGQDETARKLASDAAMTLGELEKWVLADASRAARLEAVRAARAEMLLLAGDYAAADPLYAELLAASPQRGDYLRARARIATAQLGPSPTGEALRAAQQRWETLLADPALQARAPEQYWEARCEWLSLHLRLGHADDVQAAIFQESRWYPDLGGPGWREKLEALYSAAGGTRPLTPESRPASEPRK